MKNLGEQFLHKRNTKLHRSGPVEFAQKVRRRKGEKPKQDAAQKIGDFLEIIKRTHLEKRDDPVRIERLKKSYYKNNIIKENEVPERYYDKQKRLARERGYGDIEITEKQRKELANNLINDQKHSFDKWFDYLISKDSDSFPIWAKYWAFKGMLKLGTYHKQKKKFSRRNKETVASFADLNREALAYVIDMIVKKVNKNEIKDLEDNPGLKKILTGANFGKLYSYAIEKITPTEQNELIITDGEWQKFKQGTEYMPLVKSLQGLGTGWCTAGENTAEKQLAAGNFHVYYSKNKKGELKNPRIAIRMENNNIAEVRGIAADQNLDKFIAETDILENKLDEFPDGELYKKKVSDMKLLTEIDHKNKVKENLTKEDLSFLYELDDNIVGFGYQKDPRIKEIINSRNVKKDLSLVTGYLENEISLTQKECLAGNGKIKYHYGDLYLHTLESAEGLVLPEKINGYLDLKSLKSAKGLVLPEKINGYLDLGGLESAENLVLPKKINGYLDLKSLKSAEGLVLPEKINKYLDLGGLESAEGLVFPEKINGSLRLDSLKSAEDLVFPKEINGSLDLYSLESAEDLVFPETKLGFYIKRRLELAEDLVFPKEINGDLHLHSLESAKNLVLPEKINGNLCLNSLKSTEGLVLPKEINGFLSLYSLESAEGLVLPEKINGGLIGNFK